MKKSKAAKVKGWAPIKVKVKYTRSDDLAKALQAISVRRLVKDKTPPEFSMDTLRDFFGLSVSIENLDEIDSEIKRRLNAVALHYQCPPEELTSLAKELAFEFAPPLKAQIIVTRGRAKEWGELKIFILWCDVDRLMKQKKMSARSACNALAKSEFWKVACDNSGSSLEQIYHQQCKESPVARMVEASERGDVNIDENADNGRVAKSLRNIAELMKTKFKDSPKVLGHEILEMEKLISRGEKEFIKIEAQKMLYDLRKLRVK